MRALFPRPVDDVDVHAYYAAGWLDRGGVRANFVTAVDGAVSAAGKSRGLQTPGDNRVFAALRDLADVVMAGSGTVHTEGYRPITLSDERVAVRRRYGLAATLPTAVVSRSLHLDADDPLYVDAPRDARTIVLTCTTADPAVRARLARVAEVVDCGDTTVDPALARAALEQRGLTRILCEGGPRVFGDVARAGVLDELCLSISPLLGGPGAGRIVAGDEWPDTVALSLVGLLEQDGALFGRYRTVTG